MSLKKWFCGKFLCASNGFLEAEIQKLFFRVVVLCLGLGLQGIILP